MNIPGFMAEASLYRRSMRYSLATKGTRTNEMWGVYPAKILCEETCTCDTYDFGVPGLCAKLCFDSPYGEAYPMLCDPSKCNPPCDKPICGPCTQTCHYPSGDPFTQSCSCASTRR